MHLRILGYSVLTRGHGVVPAATAILAFTYAGIAQVTPPVPPPPSLKTVPVPVPPNLQQYVQDEFAALQLGKALFWDMQVGSDGVTACASCHFHAGADNRVKNQINPGARAGDSLFFHGGPNHTLTATDFPFHKLVNPDDPAQGIERDHNDVVSSMGVFFGTFVAPRRGFRIDNFISLPDPVFNVGGVNTRRVESRNAPTVINAVFNARNFHDGRAHNLFNGVSAFGPFDANAGVFINDFGVLSRQTQRIDLASLASQAVSPPVGDLEMSARNRTWPAIGTKMLALRPLDRQLVHPQDSVLGPLSRGRRIGRTVGGLPGLNTTYPALIMAAFQPNLWNSNKIIVLTGEGFNDYTVIDRPNRALAANEYTQMEVNFSLFFGLAIQVYLSTLVSNDSPFDQYQDGNDGALTAEQLRGMDVFHARAPCAQCHVGSVFTEATVGGIELMVASDGFAFYDEGFNNIGLQPPGEDPGVGGTMPFINPVTGQPYPLSRSRLALLRRNGQLPPELAVLVDPLPPGRGSPDPDRVTVDGAFKVPTLRNVELTGPYMHNGGMATLRQVVDFYDRGGDFPEENRENLDPFIRPLGLTEAEKADLIAFLLSLTDERVRWESAPFDHPQLFVPAGLIGDEASVAGDEAVLRNGFRANEEIIEIPAVGALGRRFQGLPPLGTFLDLSPFAP